MFGRTQNCLPATIHTHANTIARAEKITKNVDKMPMHAYRIVFLNQMGDSGNKHMRTTATAAAKETQTKVHDIGRSYFHA